MISQNKQKHIKIIYIHLYLPIIINVWRRARALDGIEDFVKAAFVIYF